MLPSEFSNTEEKLPEEKGLAEEGILYFAFISSVIKLVKTGLSEIVSVRAILEAISFNIETCISL
jgi:hypothetical protein